MDYELQLKSYLSTCAGKVINVFYEIYQIIKNVDEGVQPEAILCLERLLGTIKSDDSHRVVTDYYTEAQIKKISERFIKKGLHEFIYDEINAASQANVMPIDFYRDIWKKIKTSFCKNDRECACALFSLMDCQLIPYRNVGMGISMTDEEYKIAVKKVEERVFDDTEYILNLQYEQKTQFASLLIDKLISLGDKRLQTVYLSMIIDTIEDNVEDRVKSKLRQCLDEA